MQKFFTTTLALSACLALFSCGADSGGELAAVPTTQETDLAAKSSDAASARPAADEVVEESAVAALKQMTATLSALPEFKLTLETGFDVTQPNGEKLEFGSRRTASIRRPDRAHFTYQKRSGEGGELVFDGSDIWAYDREENAYATIEQPGDIDAALDFATVELGIPVPVSDFFAQDPSITLATNVLAARDLGPSSIGGHSGRQIALRKPGVNYQIWINDTSFLPMRLVITYHEEPGQPQFWAQFLDWDTSPASPDDAFDFRPPEGAERIRFATFDSSEEEGAGGDTP